MLLTIWNDAATRGILYRSKNPSYRSSHNIKKSLCKNSYQCCTKIVQLGKRNKNCTIHIFALAWVAQRHIYLSIYLYVYIYTQTQKERERERERERDKYINIFLHILYNICIWLILVLKYIFDFKLSASNVDNKCQHWKEDYFEGSKLYKVIKVRMIYMYAPPPCVTSICFWS